MSVTHEEVLGLINVLAFSVHEQHRSNKEQHAATAQHLKKLSEVVEELPRMLMSHVLEQPYVCQI